MTTVSFDRLWRYPVKSMLGEEVSELLLGPGGVVGDRAYAFVGVESGERVSAKRHGALLGCQARCLAEPTVDEPIPPIEVTFPDGTVVQGDEEQLIRRVSELLGFAVQLTSSPPGTLVDLAPVHVVAATTLRALGDSYPDGAWDPRRFRPNILVDGGDEDGWLGCDMHVGAEASLHVVMPTPRCVVTTRAQGDLVRDQKILRTLTRVRRRQVPVLGESGCAGVYADVVRPGVVRAGDTVTTEHVAPRHGAIATALDAIAGGG